MKKCPACGSTFDDTHIFCSECGTGLVEVPSAVTPAPYPAPTEQAPAQYQEPVNQAPAQYQEPANQAYTQYQAPGNQASIPSFVQPLLNSLSFSPSMVLKEPRLGQGAYALSYICISTILNILLFLYVYIETTNLKNSISTLSMSNFPQALSAIPSLTPIYIIWILFFGSSAYIIFKRLKDMGLTLQLVQGISAVYSLIAAYALYSIHSAISAITDLFLTSMGGKAPSLFGLDRVAGKANPADAALTVLGATSDLEFGLKLMVFLMFITPLFAFFKGSPGDNEHGPKPSSF